MKYQLVLQFPEDMMDFDELIIFENRLISIMKEAVVDGHDIGSGEINIFLLTDDPKRIFGDVFNLLEKKYKENLKAGYREISKEEYEIIWPKKLLKFIVK